MYKYFSIKRGKAAEFFVGVSEPDFTLYFLDAAIPYRKISGAEGSQQ